MLFHKYYKPSNDSSVVFLCKGGVDLATETMATTILTKVAKIIKVSGMVIKAITSECLPRALSTPKNIILNMPCTINSTVAHTT